MYACHDVDSLSFLNFQIMLHFESKKMNSIIKNDIHFIFFCFVFSALWLGRGAHMRTVRYSHLCSSPLCPVPVMAQDVGQESLCGFFQKSSDTSTLSMSRCAVQVGTGPIAGARCAAPPPCDPCSQSPPFMRSTSPGASCTARSASAASTLPSSARVTPSSCATCVPGPV